MAARKAVTWAELRVGLFVLAALATVATFIFYVTGEGVLFARQIALKTYLPDVSGLKSGAPVRLAGVEIGTVKTVGLSGFRDDPARHTEVVFLVRQQFQDDIRSDSEAFITTEGLLGESVLEISRGTAGTPVPAGGVVPGTQRGNIKQVVQNVERITGDFRTLIADVRAGKGTMGKLMTDPALYDRANRAVGEFQSLTQRAANGEGTLGKLVVSEELYDQLKGTATTLDEVARDLRAGEGTLGKLIYDTTVYDKASSVVDRADRLVGRVEAGEGTLGKLITEDELHENLKQTFANARDISRKINAGEGTIGRAANDPRAYENFNELTSEIRALISDFRKDPKRYLRIKLSLF
ncbi:MAG: MCE family protein [Acidobacteria bacterium]|nr:MCE family protein [Acidobacteriota bacterium]